MEDSHLSCSCYFELRSGSNGDACRWPHCAVASPQVEEVGATGPLSLPGPRTRDPWESAAVQTNINNHIPYVASRHGALTQAKQT